MRFPCLPVQQVPLSFIFMTNSLIAVSWSTPELLYLFFHLLLQTNLLVRLITANGSTVTCSGFRTIPLRFGTWNCSWTFQLAPVSVPILGADFLRHHDLNVSVSRKKVFSDSSINGCKIDLPTSHPSPTSSFQAAFLSTPQCVSDLLSEFPDVLQSDGFTASTPRHNWFVITFFPTLARRFSPKLADWILLNSL